MRRTIRGIIGKKIGMTRTFDEAGNAIPVTVIEAGPCTITQVKNLEVDGYEAIQLGFGQRKVKHTTKPVLGHVAKAGLSPFLVLKEIRNFDSERTLKPGDTIKVDIFKPGDRVDITGVTKGKGFAGVVKRHHFRGGPKSHGQSDRWRAPGSLGQSSFPSRVYKGLRMAGRMGGIVRTVTGLRVISVNAEKNLLLVKGAVPGANKGIVIIRK